MYQILALSDQPYYVFLPCLAISGRITVALTALADAAKRLQKQGNYSVRVVVPTRDEVARVGDAFNRMAEEISYTYRKLEKLVANAPRTRQGQHTDHVAQLNG